MSNIITLNDLDLDKYKDASVVDKLRPAHTFSPDLKDRLYGKKQFEGVSLPWQKMDGILLKTKQLSIWGGSNFSGKSSVLAQVANHIALQVPVLKMSFEMEPGETLEKMCKMAAGCKPSQEFIDYYLQQLNDKLWLLDHVGSLDHERVMGAAYVASNILGIKHIVIDSFMRLDIAPTDYDKQKIVINNLVWLAGALDVHIHLIAHFKKPADSRNTGDRHQVSGSSAITDLAHNCFLVWKNEEKAKKICSGDEYNDDEPDTVITLDKYRSDGTKVNQWGLWFDPVSGQFCETSERRNIHWQGAVRFEDWIEGA
ncbi:hypothetical protein BOW50_12360 [Solemya velum gill symbiont]|uniref:AAA family ATPase n=1 Tax=Solemya velum gill symbiont TaxID=2340 RepID=UPI0009988F3A|nr:AAA family ATPase [Solemya velum gill symbiont]OOZ74851.1 hypothetical protein BOW50_12360 [Solemya velum gill symbiont]